MQSVPTSIVRGPDGALYVGELTGFPFPVGGASVYRIDPDAFGPPQVYATGFTNVVDLAFDEQGTLYVLELRKFGLLSPNPTGALVRVGPGNTRTEIASTGLVMPGGVAIRNGIAFVSNFSVVPGGGEVVAIPLG
jgi:sugar lactone lactonase YvrE